MSDILTRIVAAKQQQVTAEMQATPPAAIRAAAAAAAPPRAFAAALTDPSGAERLPVIAEIKRKSPSKGILCEPFDPPAIARQYAAAGAACLSVLTDADFFGGSNADMQASRAASGLPVLRKDFMLNDWQIYESRALGADAVLLIAAILTDAILAQLTRTAQELGMAVLVEVHDADELARALMLPPPFLLGINNRNLRTFVTDIQTTLDLLPLLPQEQERRPLVISESGIGEAEQIRRLQAAGVNVFLIGEALVREPQAGLERLFR